MQINKIFFFDLWWFLIVKSADWPMVHNSTKVCGSASAWLARIDTIIILTSFWHVTVIVHKTLSSDTIWISIPQSSWRTLTLTRVSLYTWHCSCSTWVGLTWVRLLDTFLLRTNEPILTIWINDTFGTTSYHLKSLWTMNNEKQKNNQTCDSVRFGHKSRQTSTYWVTIIVWCASGAGTTWAGLTWVWSLNTSLLSTHISILTIWVHYALRSTA